jgi:hypothetical protein
MHPSTGVRGHRLSAAPESAGRSWQQLRAEYVGSPTLSLRALAVARGVSYDALKRRARREGWASARAARLAGDRHGRDLEELARARADACRAARGLLALPAGADLAEVAKVARRVSLAVGTLWGAARIASRCP